MRCLAWFQALDRHLTIGGEHIRATSNARHGVENGPEVRREGEVEGQSVFHPLGRERDHVAVDFIPPQTGDLFFPIAARSGSESQPGMGHMVLAPRT